MKRLLGTFTIAVLAFLLSISAMGQSLNDTQWSIFEVHISSSFKRSDISMRHGTLHSTAKVVDNKLYLEKDVYSLSGEKTVKNSFALERSYRFIDQYGQKGDVLFVEDPLYVESSYRYVIFIKYENADEVRAFLSEKPIVLEDKNRKVSPESAADVVKDTLSSRSGGQEYEFAVYLKGRKLLGTVPMPTFSGRKSGKVVVKIWVDNYGIVQKAIAGEKGTTVADNTLWAAARSAAMKAKFDMDAETPALQEGSITYIFSIK